ncbi:RNA-binding protein 41-like [Helicoverpa zea]|uniref:RNA-binding protein 41-like n=1 Tax=Helicoverpa zea TaxID=7113 RepID=UPI001F5AEB87|nr:RNA-binding protein 41-like [Helicoverpa zea]
MCSESVPKEFEKTTEVLPFTKYGLSSMEEFRKAEEEVQHQEWLKKAGLTSEDIKLYQENEAGLLDQRKKIESGVLKDKLEEIYNKISNMHNESKSDSISNKDEQPSTSSAPENLIERLQQKPLTFYPEGHPMNELKQLEENLVGHIKTDMIPLSKRRKLLRRLQRKKERLLQNNPFNISTIPSTSRIDQPGSLWDMREMPRLIPHTVTSRDQEENIMGPHLRTMYTVRDNKIVRLEPVQANQEDQADQDEYRAVDIVVPVNDAEAQLLEGTKMCLDDIKKMERFKDYEPGIPSKVLYLKNIAPAVTQEQLSLLFNQFVLANGGPVDLRLMTGRMRGQAFVAFQNEELAIQALEEINGTILSGRPVIAEFGRNTNRIQDDHR